MLHACTAWLVHVHLYISLDTLPPYPLPTLPFTLCQFVILPPFPSPPSPPTPHHYPSLLPSLYPSPLLPTSPPSSLPLPLSSLPFSPPPLPSSLLPSPSSFLSTHFPSPPLPPPPYSPVLSQVKRLKLSMQHRETQFIHDTRKKEREYNRLKERLGQVMMMG